LRRARFRRRIWAVLNPDLPTIVRAFTSHLADYHLPDNVIEAYATAFYHKGKFVLASVCRLTDCILSELC